MTDGEKESLLLGARVAVPERYAPDILQAIPRSQGRDTLGFGAEADFFGVDLWHAWELSWLDGAGRPVVRVGRLQVPAESPNLVESKSLKLYLNSLNNLRFPDEANLVATIEKDLAAAAGAAVALKLFAVDDPRLAATAIDGTCIDDVLPTAQASAPDAGLLRATDGLELRETLYSHLLRSMCPVTGQPDWATLVVNYEGVPIDHGALLSYILSYRGHQAFHEQCVERMFCDILRVLAPRSLTLQAFYTRRGGLDINPFRSSTDAAAPLMRLHRQ